MCADHSSSHGLLVFFFFSSRRRHTRFDCDWSSDVCSSDLSGGGCASTPRSTWGGRASGRTSRRRASGTTAGSTDRKSVVEGKSVDLGGRRIIKKKKKEDKICARYQKEQQVRCEASTTEDAA